MSERTVIVQVAGSIAATVTLADDQDVTPHAVAAIVNDPSTWDSYDLDAVGVEVEGDDLDG